MFVNIGFVIVNWGKVGRRLLISLALTNYRILNLKQNRVLHNQANRRRRVHRLAHYFQELESRVAGLGKFFVAKVRGYQESFLLFDYQ